MEMVILACYTETIATRPLLYGHGISTLNRYHSFSCTNINSCHKHGSIELKMQNSVRIHVHLSLLASLGRIVKIKRNQLVGKYKATKRQSQYVCVIGYMLHMLLDLVFHCIVIC